MRSARCSCSPSQGTVSSRSNQWVGADCCVGVPPTGKVNGGDILTTTASPSCSRWAYQAPIWVHATHGMGWALIDMRTLALFADLAPLRVGGRSGTADADYLGALGVHVLAGADGSQPGGMARIAPTEWPSGTLTI